MDREKARKSGLMKILLTPANLPIEISISKRNITLIELERMKRNVNLFQLNIRVVFRKKKKLFILVMGVSCKLILKLV